jgi:hypothetical protein
MRLQEREQQRQEYLDKKMEAASKITGGTILLIILFGFSFGCTVLAYLATTLPENPTYYESKYPLILIPAMGAIVSWYAFLRSVRFVEKVTQENVDIPYVPPVTVDTLPTEEVLVRGAQEPTEEQSSVLLRPVEESADTPAEQLLRAAAGESEAETGE